MFARRLFLGHRKCWRCKPPLSGWSWSD
jgi:hypothetical protein